MFLLALFLVRASQKQRNSTYPSLGRNRQRERSLKRCGRVVWKQPPQILRISWPLEFSELVRRTVRSLRLDARGHWPLGIRQEFAPLLRRKHARRARPKRCVSRKRSRM